MTAARIVLVALLVTLVTAPVALGQSARKVSTTALRKQAKKALVVLKAGPDPASIENVLTLVKRLRKERKRSEALRYLKKLAPLAPESIEAQLAYAEVLHESRKTKDAANIARRLLDVGETDAVRLSAMRILGQTFELEIPALERPDQTRSRVVIVPFGRFDQTLLAAVRDAAAERLGLPAEIRRVEFELGPPLNKRNEPWFRRLKAYFKQAWDDRQGRENLSRHGFTESDLESEDRMIEFNLTALRSNPDKKQELRRFEADVRFADVPQWDADKILEQMAAATRRHKGGKIVFVAFTGSDIIVKDHPFLFSWASSGGHAVASYNRLRSVRAGEDPAWKKLRSRAQKLVVAAAGYAFAIRRCQSPDCVFGRGASLDMLDMKGERPCPACAAELRRRTGN